MSTTVRPSLLRRIPAPLFILGYGILFIAAVVTVIMLVNYEARATATAEQPTAPPPPAGPPPVWDPNIPESMAQPWLVDNASASEGFLGMRMTGDITEAATENTDALGQQIEQLLMGNCLTDLALETPENLQVDFYGSCHGSLPADKITGLVQRALDDDADALTVLDFPGNEHKKHIFLTWFADTEAEQERILDAWDTYTSDPAFDLLSMTLYGPEEVHVKDYPLGKPATNLVAPTNEAFVDKWHNR